jgi:hypothetical protein
MGHLSGHRPTGAFSVVDIVGVVQRFQKLDIVTSVEQNLVDEGSTCHQTWLGYPSPAKKGGFYGENQDKSLVNVYITIEHEPFIVDLPIKSCDFP